MTEEFLQYVWANTLFTSARCVSTRGKTVDVLNVGLLNRDSGPDFFNAKIRVDDVVLVGNVEIHQRGSDWFRHGHQKDAAYDNVVLSVVGEADMEALDSRGREIDAIVLRYDQRLWDEYVFMQGASVEPRCYHCLSRVDPVRLDMLFTGYAVERLERKCADIRALLGESRQDWESCFYRLVARYWAGNVNAGAFDQLARDISYKKIIRCGDNLFRAEALLLGYSGLLSGVPGEDEYTRALREEYDYQAAKFQLQSMSPARWKFMRIRPAAFPTLRLALLAAFMTRCHFLLSGVLDAVSLPEVYQWLDVTASPYWTTHYRPGVVSGERVKKLGRVLQDVIVINAVIPFLFVYGKEQGDERYCDKAIQWLETLPAERDHVTEAWTRRGVKLTSALQSQAVLQIKHVYCDTRQCLHCKIGGEVFRKITR